jgi:general stress protein YciG
MENKMTKKTRGFASMDPKRQKEIASKGGKAAHAKGTGHEWTSKEASVAGKKGGLAAHRGDSRRHNERFSEDSETER